MFVGIFAVSACIELLIYTRLLWKIRYTLAILDLVALSLCLIASVANSYSLVFVALFVALAIFRIINIFRILKQRMHEQYLRSVTLRSSLWIIGLQVLLAGYYILLQPQFNQQSLSLFAFFTALCALGLFISTALNIRRSRSYGISTKYSHKDLPTVTVAIPARNETDDLQDCLDSLIANTYPKLEILVLDDCSHDGTADIIKQYAHDGVRFISGSEPDNKWLPKNLAYQRLTSEASGRLILFCGVDTRFGVRSIESMVSVLLNQRVDMLSVLPLRLKNSLGAAFIQPMRYWWELAIPRWGLRRPPVLSTCWLIKRNSIATHGGFEAVSRSVLPERYFARELARESKYVFVSTKDELDVQTLKSAADQRQTALRVRYPQTHKRLELVMLLVIFEIVVFMLPFVVLICGLLIGLADYVVLLSAISVLILIMTHVMIVIFTNPANVPIALVNFPLVIFTELIIGLESMLSYEFGTVDWKERNICIPVMHVYPHLPNQEQLRD